MTIVHAERGKLRVEVEPKPYKDKNTGSSMPSLMWIKGYLTCYNNKHRPQPYFYLVYQKTTKRERMKEAKLANALQHFLDHFITSYQWQVIINSPCVFLWTQNIHTRNAQRAPRLQKKPLRCVQSRHWQLELPPAETCALAEWTWFNPCISCHGFPFSPQLWRERSLHAE